METTTKETIKFTINIKDDNVRTERAYHTLKGNVDGNMNFQEAGIAGMKNEDEIKEYLIKKHEEEYDNIVVEFEKTKINKDDLIEMLEDALKETEGFEWSGWGVAVYFHYNGIVSIGGFQSQNTWTESECFEEVYRVQSWNVDYGITEWIAELVHDNDNDSKKILAEIDSKFNDRENVDIDELSNFARKDYVNAYDIELSESIDNAKEIAIEAIEQKIEEYELPFEIVD